MDRPYLSIISRSEGVWKDRGSSFHALAVPVQDATEFQNFLAEWTAIHRGARHHAWAYRLRTLNGLEERCHDAGEPSHSAGTPILHALQSAEVQNAAAVVSRYFGGTKLGVGGLVAAYRGAADDALTQSETQLVHPERWAQLELPYDLLGRMDADAHDPRIRWVVRDFTEHVVLTVAVWSESAAFWEAHWDQLYPLKWAWVPAP